MILQFNLIQEIFLVLYSILYGTMLQSLSGLGPFSWGKTQSKMIYRLTKLSKIATWRLVISLWLLNLAPIFYFLVTLTLLRKFNPPYHLYSLSYSILPLLYMGCSCMAVFGFYRLYICLPIWKYTKWMFYDNPEAIRKRKINPIPRGHVYSLLFYFVPPIFFNFIDELLRKPVAIQTSLIEILNSLVTSLLPLIPLIPFLMVFLGIYVPKYVTKKRKKI